MYNPPINSNYYRSAKVMAASCFIFKCHLIVTFALIDAGTGLIVNKIQSFAKTPVIDTDNINERA